MGLAEFLVLSIYLFFLTNIFKLSSVTWALGVMSRFHWITRNYSQKWPASR